MSVTTHPAEHPHACGAPSNFDAGAGAGAQRSPAERAASSLAVATPAMAVVFVVGRRMLVYHLQPLDSGTVPVLLDPPRVAVCTPGHAHGPPQPVTLECFAVRCQCSVPSGLFHLTSNKRFHFFLKSYS